MIIITKQMNYQYKIDDHFKCQTHETISIKHTEFGDF